ncbi:uncharacterized protein LOC129312360 [Prosopis cineraria]|uniref:uncharacterized protein LOC129312360 n=1 Tax=Prosopis cineraria TaxID=364024 RepID=UPI00240FCA60|nr:uncharacterized protein LOC129312360 [Prosopis cineraria]XP_054810896.1 uncharacterized protein LOC129312360 [Prosopis cineraria]XP_054810897.1 uncharacterized protein LOC129312360 [Prosopis cineraria]XP_054810898.1 uncharacterized protein LOC129312360 [Prosopis cineraria]XP_054810899.1 uncharacterized protein LOC129312360 [Prosopis cineraria]XP_054810900.1 uncharacterized protein LOC129312360 [Prosopis cineraria]XP_054810901.1 uncharacterized protein LOC129312360 [Prosopis cineraria]XP_0
MGKKGGAKRLPNSTSGPHTPISLREEATGKLHKKTGSNVKSMLKLDHLKNLAVWASREVSIPSLGAFYGQCLASAEEAMGVPPLDPSLVTCERCEIVLHPGFNCTIRIEKRRTKGKHGRKKFGNDSQNSVAYKCHYCSHQNLKKGTFKGHMKVICPPKEKSPKQSKPRQALSHESGKSEEEIMNKDEANDTNHSASRVAAIDVATIHGPATPPVPSLTTALEGSKRKRNGLGSNKASELASMSAQKDAGKATNTSSKRRRKSWTSLKEIAQSSEHNSSIANLSIPFIF